MEDGVQTLAKTLGHRTSDRQRQAAEQPLPGSALFRCLELDDSADFVCASGDSDGEQLNLRVTPHSLRPRTLYIV